MNYIRPKNCVIYSFKGKWLAPIIAGRVKVFFRKRCPRALPSRAYFYVGTPTCAIIGWAEVLELKRVDAKTALGMTIEGAISHRELVAYLKDTDSVGIFNLGPPKLFGSPLSVDDVRKIINFHPPQNFVQIACEDALKLDDLGK